MTSKDDRPEQDGELRMRAEEDTVRAAREWQTTFDAVNDAIWILDQEQRILRSNRTADLLFRRMGEELAGKHCWEIVHGTAQPIPECPILRARNSLRRETTDLQIGDGWFQVTVDPILDEAGQYAGAVHIVSDITEPKRAEALLQEIRARYEATFEATGTATLLVEEDATIIMANHECLSATGYSPEELLGTKWPKYVAPESLEAMLQYHNLRREDPGKAPRNYEIKLVNKKGEIRNVILDVAVIPVTRQSVVSMSDVTERKRAETELRKVNRALNLISLLNQEMACANDEMALLQVICRLAVENGGYHMAWVGFAEQDEAKSVHPVAQAGFEDGYLDTVNITWADVERGRGPTGTAIRTGQPVLTRNICSDPAFEPWREAAIQYGYASSLALPLHEDGRCFGALNLYATVPDAFDPEEVKLLGKLANDLAYGIGALRNRIARKRAEKEIIQAKNDWESTFNAVTDMITVHDMDFNIVRANSSATATLGLRLHEGIPVPKCFKCYHGTETPPPECRSCQSLRTQMPCTVEMFEPHLGKHLEIRTMPRFGDDNHRMIGLIHIARDITESKREEEEKAKLESQLQQAQKMESVGRLAGGVAHDFNNMLGVILGTTEMALEKIDPDNPLHDDLEEIRNAASRSADLTRQLLAFARKQTISPKVLDMNETVEGMLKMLRRLIGEDIHLAWQPMTNLWPVRVDPSQIDQILANLCINAKDAIADVGKITIETDNIVFDEAYYANHQDIILGEYVMIAVSDDGCGMDKEMLAYIFEPFFTTKGKGKGTGLGLATVYGIVKQNKGFINVYSEPEQGTMFKIYLPRHASKAGEAPTEDAGDEPIARGNETILLVEDEPSILKMSTRMLERQGYTVLAAKTPGEAIQMARERNGEIDLLMTDVIMPEMNGRDLAKNLLSLYPRLKRLFMSGYTSNVIAHHGVLDEVVCFIQKPFSTKSLAVKVREALNH